MGVSPFFNHKFLVFNSLKIKRGAILTTGTDYICKTDYCNYLKQVLALKCKVDQELSRQVSKVNYSILVIKKYPQTHCESLTSFLYD